MYFLNEINYINSTKLTVIFVYQGPLRTFLDLSQQIGSDVATQANLVNAAFQ